ncbi:MAG: transposase [Proteobacteria bacterium]|nr:transposase [Pseudomonadota bacterium]
MPRSYSLDLRERIARYVDNGGSRHAAAAHFDVSVSFVVKLMAAFRQTGCLTAKPEGGWRYSKLDPHRDFLIRRVSEKDDITMSELAAELAERGTIVDPSSISRWLIRNGYRFKKNIAGQRARPAGRGGRTPDMDGPAAKNAA